MAPKLPPPANTKAVFAGAWFDMDKVLFAPAVDALTKSHATFGWFIAAENGPALSRSVVEQIRSVRRTVCSVRRHDRLPGWSEGQTSDAQLRIGESGKYHLEIPGSRLGAPRDDGWETERLSVRRRLSRSQNGRARCYCLRQNRAPRTSGAALPAWPGCRTS